MRSDVNPRLDASADISDGAGGTVVVRGTETETVGLKQLHSLQNYRGRSRKVKEWKTSVFLSYSQQARNEKKTTKTV